MSISQWIEVAHGRGRGQRQPARTGDAGRGGRCAIGRARPAVDGAIVVVAYRRVVHDGGPGDDDGEHQTADDAHAEALAGPEGSVKRYGFEDASSIAVHAPAERLVLQVQKHVHEVGVSRW